MLFSIPRDGEGLGAVGLWNIVDTLHSFPLLLCKSLKHGKMTAQAGLLDLHGTKAFKFSQS